MMSRWLNWQFVVAARAGVALWACWACIMCSALWLDRSRYKRVKLLLAYKWK